MTEAELFLFKINNTKNNKTDAFSNVLMITVNNMHTMRIKRLEKKY